MTRFVTQLSSRLATATSCPLPVWRIGITGGLVGILCRVGPTVLALFGIVSAGTVLVWANNLYDKLRLVAPARRACRLDRADGTNGTRANGNYRTTHENGCGAGISAKPDLRPAELYVD